MVIIIIRKTQCFTPSKIDYNQDVLFPVYFSQEMSRIR
jgi:hypothetical protein